jgi:hypothetical protein
MCGLAVFLTVFSMHSQLEFAPPTHSWAEWAEGLLDVSLALEVALRLFLEPALFCRCDGSSRCAWNVVDVLIAGLCLVTFALMEAALRAETLPASEAPSEAWMNTVFVARDVVRLLRVMVFFHALRRAQFEWRVEMPDDDDDVVSGGAWDNPAGLEGGAEGWGAAPGPILGSETSTLLSSTGFGGDWGQGDGYASMDDFQPPPSEAPAGRAGQ